MNALEKISAYSFIEENGYAYLSNMFYNGMFKINLETGETVFWGEFDNEKLSEKRLHMEAFQRDEKIYFCPRRGRHVHIFNLKNQTMISIEIRKKTEDFFVIENVYVKNDDVFFIPSKKKFGIRKMNMTSLMVTKESQEIRFQGNDLSKYRTQFPVNGVIEKYHIRAIDKFFWKRIPDKGWYGFLPEGCMLLQYREGMNEIKKLPLIVSNYIVLNKHLEKVKKELFKEGFIREDMLGIQNYLDYIKTVNISNDIKPVHYKDIGRSIWNIL